MAGGITINWAIFSGRKSFSTIGTVGKVKVLIQKCNFQVSAIFWLYE